jgi:hypothetical protein
MTTISSLPRKKQTNIPSPCGAWEYSSIFFALQPNPSQNISPIIGIPERSSSCSTSYKYHKNQQLTINAKIL